MANARRATARAGPKRLVSLVVGGEYLGVSAKTMRRFIDNGRLTGYRVGTRLRVDMDEVEAMPKVVPRPSRSA